MEAGHKHFHQSETLGVAALREVQDGHGVEKLVDGSVFEAVLFTDSLLS